MSKKFKITSKSKKIAIIGGSITAATAAIVAPVVVLTTNAKKNEETKAVSLKSGSELKKAKDDAKALIDSISIAKAKGHDAGLFTKIEEEKAAAKKAIDAATNINEINSLVSYKDGSLSGSEVDKVKDVIQKYTEKSKENEEAKAKALENAKINAKSIIDNIDEAGVNAHDKDSYAKIAPARTAAKNAIDAATTIDQIKSLANVNNDGSLTGTEFEKVKNIVEEYKNKSKKIAEAKAKALENAKINAKSIIDNIDENGVNAHDKESYAKIAPARTAAKNAIDAATTIDQIKSLANVNNDGSITGTEFEKVKNIVKEYKGKSKKIADAESKAIKEAKDNARNIIDNIKFIQVGGHDEGSFNKIKDVIKESKNAINGSTTIEQIKSLANSPSSGSEVNRVKKAIQDYEGASAVKLVEAKTKAKDLIDGIKVTQVDGHDVDTFNKIQPAKEEAKKAIDAATNITNIKSLADNDGSLNGTEVAKVQKLVEEYNKKSAANFAQAVMDAKTKAKGLIDGIKVTKVDGHDEDSFNKIQPAKDEAKKAIDAATNITNIKSLANNENSSLSGTEVDKVQKLVGEYKSKSKENVDAEAAAKIIDNKEKASAKMSFDNTSKILTIRKGVTHINYNISSIWSDIKKIEFEDPENILEIGSDAFRNSTLTNLDLSGLSNLTSIGHGAFNKSKLTSLDLSGLSNLTSIGGEAFYSSELTDLDLSGLSNLTSIGTYAFYYSLLTNLDLSGLSNLTSIESEAFSSSELTDLDLSGLSNLTSIGDRAFSSSTLTDLDLSGLSNLTSIKYKAFNSIEKNARVKISQAKWNSIIKGREEYIFGSNGKDVTRTD